MARAISMASSSSRLALDDPRHDAVAQRFVRVERAAGEDQIADEAMATHLEETRRAPESGTSPCVADNTLADGRVVEGDPRPPIADFNEHVAADPRTVQVLLSVRDGLTLIRLA